MRVAILTGAGDKAFCAGIDLVEFTETNLGMPPPDFLPVLGENIEIPKPIIAAVNGVAYAGGWRLCRCATCVSQVTSTLRDHGSESRARHALGCAPYSHDLAPHHVGAVDDRQPDLGTTGL